MHDKNHSYGISLGIVILILCIYFPSLHCLSTSEFIWTADLWDRDSPNSQTRNEYTDKQNESQGVYAFL